MTATLPELEARIIVLETKVGLLNPNLRVDPAWARRTCAVCGIPAEIIDISVATLATSRNGEGYCLRHATANAILDGEHLTKV